jgi:hypothetical protein
MMNTPKPKMHRLRWRVILVFEMRARDSEENLKENARRLRKMQEQL